MGGIGKLPIYLIWQRVNDFIAARSVTTMCNCWRRLSKKHLSTRNDFFSVKHQASPVMHGAGLCSVHSQAHELLRQRGITNCQRSTIGLMFK
jgi:hypothetical protein